jgi:elongation factor G
MNDPPFLIDVAIEPEASVDQNALIAALAKLVADDPSLGFAVGEGGEVILKGMSEEHLDAAVTSLKRERRLDLLIGAPLIAYRERLTSKVEISHTHKKLHGAAGQFAEVAIVFEPVAIGAGSTFESQIANSAVPEKYIPGVEKGVASAMSSGVVAGFPVVDVKTTLIDGAYHEDDSSELSFEIAARAATREALQKGRSVLLEPIMKVEVVAPEEYEGFVIGDIRSRRGEVLGQNQEAGREVVEALVSLASMFGYGSTLRSGTRGHASFSMRFSHYAQVPPSPGGDDHFPPAVGMRA